MNIKTKKKTYQNLWHLPKLTKKQVQWAKFKTKIHFGELGRPTPKHRMLKTVDI